MLVLFGCAVARLEEAALFGEGCLEVMIIVNNGGEKVGILTEKQEKLLVLFKSAIQREKEAQEHYSRMLSLNEDPVTNSIIEKFIEQEKQHEKALLNLYSDLRKIGDFKNAK
jgi:rubrerythrin